MRNYPPILDFPKFRQNSKKESIKKISEVDIIPELRLGKPCPPTIINSVFKLFQIIGLATFSSISVPLLQISSEKY
jgi:hypothetical protein